MTRTLFGLVTEARKPSKENVSCENVSRETFFIFRIIFLAIIWRIKYNIGRILKEGDKMSNNFIDISEHNTILSYGAIADSNLKGVIIKATEGTTFIDHALENNYLCLKGKVNLGFYHYLTSTSAPQTQAQNFWNQIKDKDYNIIPVLDVEQDALSNNAESYSEQFLEEFYKLSGHNMIIYSGRCYIEEHFSDSFKRNNNWWVADYSASETPIINGCNIIAWQYTENCQSYAFTMGDLDCSELINADQFYLDKCITIPPVVEKTNNNSIDTLQQELTIQGYRDKNCNRLIVDGIAGELTLSACPTVAIGAHGTITKWIQSRLGIDADGIFGVNTRQAITEFQKHNGVSTDGIVGKNTWRKLLGL